MTPRHRFAQITFAAAGIYGLLVTAPLYWMAERIGHDSPPELTHVEYFYGFIGVVIAWQLVFLLIARNPSVYRTIIPIAVVEKIGFAAPAFVLYARHALAATTFAFGVIDLVLALLFSIAYVTL
jgi:hypothetical protein